MLSNCSEMMKSAEFIDENKKNLSKFSYELQQAHKIVKDLMSDGHKGVNGPFMGPIGEIQTIRDLADYNEVIKTPIWLGKVKEKIFKEEYKTLTEVVADIRLILENCYRYHGPNNIYTKKGLRLEQILEQKLALLPRDLREKTTLEATYGRPCCEEVVGTRRRSTRQSMDYTSFILNQVKHERELRDKEHKKKQIEEKKAEKDEREKGIIDWENTTLLAEPLKSDMKAMWELPLIGHFLYLCQTVLNMPEVTIYELERILAMPRASTLLPRIMTSLLSNPQQRVNLDRKPPMPYKVWQNRLQGRVQSWYKIHQARNNRADLVFQQLGIEADFFRIMGPENPLLEKKFHELTFHQRVWLVKSLCDYILQSHKSIQDTLNEKTMEDMRGYVLGSDAKGNSYLHFPQFCGQDLRIYRQSRVRKPPSPSEWGAISLKKRQTPQNDVLTSSVTKKSKICDSPPVSPRSSPTGSNSQSPHLSNARRSLRLSKVTIDSLTMEVEPHRSISSEDEEEEESDVEESEDEDVSLEPNITKFELIVDSVECLRNLIDSLKSSTVGKGNKVTESEKNESELRDHLNNLLKELEPWETKLQKATQRLRQKLRKEWDEFVEKEEEVEEDIWGSDRESELKKSSSIESSSSDSSSSSDDEFTPGSKPSSIFAQGIEKATLDLFGDNDFGEFRTRGQWRQLKNLKLNSADQANITRPKNGTINLIPKPSQQNCTSKGNELHAWETLQQILVPNSNSVSDSLGTVTSKTGSSAFNSLGEILTTLSTKNESMPERKNMTKSEVDILGAIQAATSLAKNHEMAEMKEKSVNSNHVLARSCSFVTEKAVIKAPEPSRPNCINPRLMPPSLVTTSPSVSVALTCTPQVSASSKRTSVLNNSSADPGCIPTKRQLCELSSIAENTENLRGLLQQANQKARSKNNFIVGGNSMTTNSQPSSNTTRLSVKSQDGKLVYYQVTPRLSGSTMDKPIADHSEPSALTPSKATVSLNPQLADYQPSQQVMLLPIKDHSGKIIQYVSISTNYNGNENNHDTNVAEKPPVLATDPVSNDGSSKMKFQSVVTPSPSKNLSAPMTEQKMILIPVSNHQGQTTYLKLPTNSVVANPSSPNVSVTQVASIVSPLQPTAVVATNHREATMPMSHMMPMQRITTQQPVLSQRPRTSAAVVPRKVCYRPTPTVQSNSPTSTSNVKSPVVMGTSPKMASPTSASGVQIAGSNTSLATLLANNPTLSANVQKLAMTGRKVVLSQQGGRFILHAAPNDSVSKSSFVAQRPQTTASSSVLNVSVSTAQVTAKPSLCTVVSHLKRSSETLTSNLPTPLIVAHNQVPQPNVLGVPVPTTALPQLTTVTRNPTNLVCVPNMSGTQQNIQPNTPLVQSVTVPNSSTVTGSDIRSTEPATTQTSIKSKLVMIHNIDSGKQILGLLLDNGQVLPLNATVSVSSNATAETNNH